MRIKPDLQPEFDNFVKINSDDAYSKATVDYTIAWADLMEKGIADGMKLEDIAEEASHKADTEGITGFMYGLAAKVLAHFWEHGEALRIWHNGQYGVGPDKKGIVNPAILTIGGKDDGNPGS